MSLSSLLTSIRPCVEQHVIRLPEPWPALTLFLSLCNGRQRARVVHASGDDFDTLWQYLEGQARLLAERERLQVLWLRIDWVTAASQLDWATLRGSLKSYKRNYFRHGLALDRNFDVAFLEQELNANAMLYGGAQINHAVINEKNFSIYARNRFRGYTAGFSDAAPVYVLSTQGVFCAAQEPPQLLYPTGKQAGRRIIEQLNVPLVTGLVERGSAYLASQVQDDGRFSYGWHPCFDRQISAYNSLRHASTLYSMFEALEVTGEGQLSEAADKALQYLLGSLIKQVMLPNGEQAAFLLDPGNEIKLGGNAVCLLALSKHAELYACDDYKPLMAQLAAGMAYMQNPDTGAFVHVLNYPDLSVKEAFRIIYYDGEAAFGLMRLYRLTQEPRWLAMVEKAFEHFIAAEHWQAHDHWLGYCVNELTLYRPEERYFRFGIRNVAGHLDFVRKRITTFPTLLELMMAANSMIGRLQQHEQYAHLLEEIDLEAFDQALNYRADYLLNGHFWPEYAMYFRNPQRILGSFFIRHHAFRVRIDDVEHYLSGYVAYLKYLQHQPAPGQPALADMATERAP